MCSFEGMQSMQSGPHGTSDTTFGLMYRQSSLISVDNLRYATQPSGLQSRGRGRRCKWS